MVTDKGVLGLVRYVLMKFPLPNKPQFNTPLSLRVGTHHVPAACSCLSGSPVAHEWASAHLILELFADAGLGVKV